MKLRKVQINDIVYLKYHHKLKQTNTGPFLVTDISPVTVKIQRYGETSAPKMRIHINYLWTILQKRSYLKLYFSSNSNFNNNNASQHNNIQNNYAPNENNYTPNENVYVPNDNIYISN